MRMLSKIAVPVFTLAALTFAQSSWAQAAPATAAPTAPAATASSSAAPAVAHQLHFASGTILPVELDKSIDAKKAHQGDPVVAKVDQDFLSNGKIVIPRNSKVVGHITEAKASSHDDKKSMLGVAFDKIVVKDGTDIPLNASVQGIGAPISTNNDNGGYGGGMTAPSQTNPSGMNGSSPMGGSGSAGANPSPSAMGGSGGNNSAPNGPDSMPMGQHVTALPRTFQGISGLKGLSLSQGQMQDSVISSDDHNVKLDSGTQILLRTR